MRSLVEWIRRNSVALSAGALLLAFLGKSSRAQAAVLINEFMANNTRTLRDDNGKYSDWVELFNWSPSAANIGGYYMSDTSSEPMKWRIPTGTTIATGDFLLIWCDGTTIPKPLKPLHASFKMNATDGELIALYAPDGATTVSYKYYGQQAPDISYGRITDANSEWVPFLVPSPRRQNISGQYFAPPPLAGKLFLNEWLTSNTSGIKAPNGKHEDWFELYNAWDKPIDLGDYFLTDDLLKLTQWKIPKGNVIGPKGFALFWAIGKKASGFTEADFKLGDQSGVIRLSEKLDLSLIDQVDYGRQRANISQGRLPDGAPPPPAGFPFLSRQTPRSSNYPPSGARRWERYR